MVASYPSHHVALFTINGKKLRNELHSDNVQVVLQPSVAILVLTL